MEREVPNIQNIHKYLHQHTYIYVHQKLTSSFAAEASSMHFNKNIDNIILFNSMMLDLKLDLIGINWSINE